MNAIIYAAKSTKDPRGSIPTQLEDGRQMASREGWVVVGEYSDEAASGWSGDRGPALAAALDHAQRIAPCVLVVQHSDRLARGDGKTARHLGELYFWALKADVSMRSAQDDSTFTNPLLAFAMGESNSQQSQRKSLAVAAGMKRRAQAGQHHGGPRRFGYRAVDGQLLVVEAERPIVARVFNEFVAEGKSLTAIARDLYRDGIPTTKDGTWRSSTVAGMLGSPLYIARVINNGETFQAEHEALVDLDVWETAQEMLAARAQRGRGRPPGGNHLFRGGMLRCRCGEAMVPRTNGGYQMYYCNGRSKLGRDFCDMPHVRRVEIDSSVYRYFELAGLDVEATYAALRSAETARLGELRVLHKAAEREVQQAEERLARVRRDYADGRIDARDWYELRGELTEERAGAQAQVLSLAERLRAVADKFALGDAESDALRALADIRAAVSGAGKEDLGPLRATLGRLFECFVLYRYVERVHVDLIPNVDLAIEPIVRPNLVRGFSDLGEPLFGRTPLDGLTNKQDIGFPTPRLFGPIAVGAR